MKYETIKTLNGNFELPIAENYADTFELIRSDYFRKNERSLNWGGDFVAIKM